jgi:hypothetical protein
MGKDEVKMQDLIKEGSRSHTTEGENTSVKEKFFFFRIITFFLHSVESPENSSIHAGASAAQAATAQRGACLCLRRRRASVQPLVAATS